MSVFDRENIGDKVLQSLGNVKQEILYFQYLHKADCETGPCGNSEDFSNHTCCAPFIWCIHASDNLHDLPKHPNCDCYYERLEEKQTGTISEKQPAPDVWLKIFGKLPDYYITKKEAEELGWKQGKNTIAGKAPGKMIGGERYYNDKHRLPEKEGRLWYECDIDYKSGGRSSERLFYSDDGLMFYSPDHGEQEFYLVK